MKNIKFNKNIIFQFLLSIVILILFLFIIFPGSNPILLIFYAIIIISFLNFIINKNNKRPLRMISVRQRYILEKIALGISGIFLDIAALFYFGLIFWFFFQEDHDVITFIAIGVMGLLGFVCLFFGVLITRTFIFRYRSFKIYQKLLAEEELKNLLNN